MTYGVVVWLDLFGVVLLLVAAVWCARLGCWSAAALDVLIAVWMARAGVANAGRAGHDIDDWTWLLTARSSAMNAAGIILCAVTGMLESHATHAHIRRLERRLYGKGKR